MSMASSRIPKPQPSTPTKSRISTPVRNSTPPTRTRIKSTTRSTTPSKLKAQEDTPLPPPPPLSIKEAIALKRAEAKKAKSAGGLDNLGSLEDAIPTASNVAPEEDLLGRLSVKETIERARSTGTLNLSTRSLPCIPSILFEIHLRVTPGPLTSVPDEPSFASESSSAPRRGGKYDAPAWFEGQDLRVLKVGNNAIAEIQHEISMFGSLKVVDLHKNKLLSLPDTLGDLSSLTILDLSHNALSVLPPTIFSLPELTTLNLAHNQLPSLPFNAPFSDRNSRIRYTSTDPFAPVVNRSITPLPRLITLDVSHNKLASDVMDIPNIPTALTKLDISSNPLGIHNSATRQLLQKLGTLSGLKELRLDHAEIGDDAFPPDFSSGPIFPQLHLLDVGETAVTMDAIKVALKGLKQNISYDLTMEEPCEGTIRVLVGKKIIREQWELEAERRAQSRFVRNAQPSDGTELKTSASEKIKTAKESWEMEAEQGLLTEGGKRRARAQAAAAVVSKSAPLFLSKPPAPAVKEAWEIEAEQGLLTEGGKRRARAAAAQTPSSKPSSGQSAFSLANSQCYSEATQTLILPPSAPPPKSAHSRTFSLALHTSPSSLLSRTDIAIPTPTLPLASIVTEAFAENLKVLVLVNRRMDRSFSLPTGEGPFLPHLEELNLEGCSLADQVPVSHPGSDTTTPNWTNESLLPLIAKLFPSLQTLKLSYNVISSSCLTTDALSSLILCTSQRKGLKRLELRGNKITTLEGLQGITELFKGHRDVPGWKLDELDLRDNEIGKLPPELGLLPLDVFLVDGNLFRVPTRRVWEREGTKGLLSWLRGRIE
ncbi:L domain-like protein [Guyanagaster necrorhizus]|uniref:L domain-like protein n=1 Tax=Guyanagaster necrorhizus TaxID=856835 RepID=A0A9P8AX62_9AGAR|nr:L domain-like protein [Guyanagaster necrorhizus MCA 3950]KAG7451429.1 L domain-like protein [Guyanagaster necrorhizus MCA 3950]